MLFDHTCTISYRAYTYINHIRIFIQYPRKKLLPIGKDVTFIYMCTVLHAWLDLSHVKK